MVTASQAQKEVLKQYSWLKPTNHVIKFKNLYIVELSAIEGVSTLLDCFFSVNQNTGEVDTFVPLENPEFFNNDKIEHIWL